MFNSLSKLNLNRMQVIQNCALRNICKVWFRGGVTDILHIKADIPRIIERMHVLGNNFLKRSKLYKNPLIYPLVNEFKNFLDYLIDNGVSELNNCPLAFFEFDWHNW